MRDTCVLWQCCDSQHKVLGAAMFYARVGGKLSVLYTGDFNMTPDRHLGAARVDEQLRPDLLITETT